MAGAQSFRVEHATRVLFPATRRKHPTGLRCGLRAQNWSAHGWLKINRQTPVLRMSAASRR